MKTMTKKQRDHEAAQMKNDLPELAGLISDILSVANDQDEAARDYFKAARTVCSIYFPDTLAKAFRQLNAQMTEMAQGRGIDYALGYLMTSIASRQL
jgi:arginine exporter protein ArgO